MLRIVKYQLNQEKEDMLKVKGFGFLLFAHTFRDK